MSEELSTSIDPARARMRQTIAIISRQIAALPHEPDDGSASDASLLATAWADLVSQLALGPEPAVRTCPKCGTIGMREAKVCGHCWTKLAPLPESDEAVGSGPAD